MVVPDFELICEIMLVAEGFLDARLLARKFITLYSLCKELLSKQVTSEFFACCLSSFSLRCTLTFHRMSLTVVLPGCSSRPGT